MKRTGVLRRYAMVVVVASVVTVVGACSSGSGSPSGGSSGTLAKMSLTNFQGTLLALPVFVAADKGFFKDNGLDVGLVSVASGPASLQALLTGSVDMMLNSPEVIMGANAKGQSVKVVAGDTVTNIQTLLARKGWPVPNAGTYPAAIRDLKGAKIGVTALGSLQEIQLKSMLQDAGLNPDKDVTIVATGLAPSSMAALEAGQIDAWMGIEPGTTIAVHQRKIANVVLDMRKGQGPSDIVNYSTNMFAAKTDYINSHGDLVKRFTDAIAQAQAWIQDPANLAAVEAEVAKNVPVDASLVPQMVKDNLMTFGAAVAPDHIDNAIKVAKAGGLVHGSPTYQDLVDTQYAKAN